MSKGTDERTRHDRPAADRGRTERGEVRSSKTSVQMTPDRARAIKDAADRRGRDDGFADRAGAAAERNEHDDDEEP